MLKNQTSIRNGIEDFLCPFTKMFITQGANGQYSHMGTMANDVNNGAGDSKKAPYYAPCTVKCIKAYKSNGQAIWQSINKVRFANGRIDYATFVTAHDNTFDARVGQIVKQGQQLGNMGNKGNATGVHCHIQISQSRDTTFKKNKYGILMFNNEYDTDDCYFCDNTEILNMKNANWKYLKDVPVEQKKNEWEVGNYQILISKILRMSTNVNLLNRCRVKNIDKNTQKLLTSSRPNDIAMFKVGSIIPIAQIIHKDGLIWGRYYNTYIVLRNKDGSKQATLL